MRTSKSLTIGALALALALAAPACKSSDCEKAYDMAKKCDKGDKADESDKGDFVSFCEKARADPKQKEEVEVA